MTNTSSPALLRERKDAWEAVAERIYEKRKAGHVENVALVNSIFEEEKELLSPLVERCPGFVTILSFILENKFHRVREVDKKLNLTDWGDEECQRVGCSLSTFIRKRKTGAVAIDSWRLNYTQLDVLFKEGSGRSRLMRDSVYGTVFRVTLGAVLCSD